MQLNAKTIAVAAVALVVAGGIGYSIGNPEAVAGLTGSLTGAVTSESATYLGVRLAIGTTEVPRVRNLEGCNWLVPTGDGTTATGLPEVRPCVATVTAPLPPVVYQWLADTLTPAKTIRRDVTVLMMPSAGESTVESFVARNALLTGVEFAPFDASSTSPYLVTLTFQPDSIERDVGTITSGGKSPPTVTAGAFRVRFDNSDLSVRSIAGFNVTAPAQRATPSGADLSVRWNSTPARFSGVTLVASQLEEQRFAGWENDALKGVPARHTIAIDMRDSAGAVVQVITISNAGFVEYAPLYPATSALYLQELTVQPGRIEVT